MEKSGCLQLTQTQLDLIEAGNEWALVSLMQEWEIDSFGELKAIVGSGQYRLVEPN